MSINDFITEITLLIMYSDIVIRWVWLYLTIISCFMQGWTLCCRMHSASCKLRWHDDYHHDIDSSALTGLKASNIGSQPFFNWLGIFFIYFTFLFLPLLHSFHIQLVFSFKKPESTMNENIFDYIIKKCISKLFSLRVLRFPQTWKWSVHYHEVISKCWFVFMFLFVLSFFWNICLY